MHHLAYHVSPYNLDFILLSVNWRMCNFFVSSVNLFFYNFIVRIYEQRTYIFCLIQFFYFYYFIFRMYKRPILFLLKWNGGLKRAQSKKDNNSYSKNNSLELHWEHDAHGSTLEFTIAVCRYSKRKQNTKILRFIFRYSMNLLMYVISVIN
jgi:hypothetical protein